MSDARRQPEGGAEVPRDPFDDVQPIGRSSTRATPRTGEPAAAPVDEREESTTPADTRNGTTTSHTLEQRVAMTLDGETPATTQELIAMLSHLARRLFSEAADPTRKAYERENLGRTLGAISDKLATLLAKPTPETPTDDAVNTRALCLLATRVAEAASTGRGVMRDSPTRAREEGVSVA